MENGLSTVRPQDVSLSIVSHGDRAKIGGLLESLRTCEPDRQFQILLTDNLGNELPEYKITGKDSISVIRNHRPQGFARNNNLAFQKNKSEYFCTINPDVVLTQPVFDRLVSLIETGKADIVTPLIVDGQEIVQDSFRPLPRPIDLVRRKLPGYHFSPLRTETDGFIRPDWIAGIFMLMKGETFQRLGGFDEKYHLYFEDVDLCTRARLQGLKILVDPGIKIRHDAQRASRKSLLHLFWHIQSAIRFYRSPTYHKAIGKSKKAV